MFMEIEGTGEPDLRVHQAHRPSEQVRQSLSHILLQEPNLGDLSTHSQQEVEQMQSEYSSLKCFVETALRARTEQSVAQECT